MSNQTIVLKFGGAAVATPEQFGKIAEIVAQYHSRVQHVVCVVSAMGDMTDVLDQLARRVHPNPPSREYDMLVSVGERISSALLAMALSRRGVEAISLTGSQSGIITTTEHGEAEIVEVRPFRILPELAQHKVVIVAGFQGVSTDKQITTLGRGGSDTTAVALASEFNCGVIFFKDVAGVYASDPKKGCDTPPYAKVSYEQLLEILDGECGVLHPRAVLYAQKMQVPLWVRSFKDLSEPGTFVDASPELFAV